MNSLSPNYVAVKPRKQRRRRQNVSSPPMPAALNLTAADNDESVTSVTMQFDRAIDIASMDVTQIQVGDFGTSGLYRGSGTPTLTDERTVRVGLVLIGPFGEVKHVLIATAATGIVAADDGGTWAGTDGTNLPFP